VNVSGAGDEPWYDLAIAGAGFDDDDGKLMRIVAGTEMGNRLAVVELPILAGGFEVTIPQVLNDGWYVTIVVYVDRNDDDACSADEHVLEWNTGPVHGDLEYGVRPGQLCVLSLDGCRPWTGTLPPCQVGADWDLTEKLACRPGSGPG